MKTTKKLHQIPEVCIPSSPKKNRLYDSYLQGTLLVRAPDSVSRLFRLVPMPEGTKMLRVDPIVVDHAENEYHRAHVRRWGVSGK